MVAGFILTRVKVRQHHCHKIAPQLISHLGEVEVVCFSSRVVFLLAFHLGNISLTLIDDLSL